MKQFLGIFALLAFAITTVLSSCGESEQHKAERLVQDSIHNSDSIKKALKPRQDVLDIAIGKIREQLKAPSSARFAILASDSVIIAGGKFESPFYNDEAINQPDDGNLVVTVPYEAQNSYGVYLPGVHEVYFIKTGGIWQFAMGLTEPILDVKIIYADMLKAYRAYERNSRKPTIVAH